MKATRTIRTYTEEEIEIDEEFIFYDKDGYPYLTDEGLEEYVYSKDGVCEIVTEKFWLYDG